MSNITIYHNPACGTSRNTLEMIRNSGTEPTIIYYLEHRQRAMNWSKLIADMGISVRALLRKN
ncbi:arsenate reductase, partial [Klebsiella pneumoniae]|nr:arsenate reductase [Klebsiella pneumoniae]